MTAPPRRDDPRDAEHGAVAELLPWYVNETLEREEAAQVEEHLPRCAACRDELARCRALAVAARAAPRDEASWAPSPRHFQRVLDRIDAAERGRAGARARALLGRVRAWLSDTPRPVRWVLAGEGVAALALAAMLVVGRAPPAPTYETRARPAHGAAADADVARLHLVFAEDATERELRELLRGVDGAVVAGPSPRAVYTVALAVRASDRERVEAIAARLRRAPLVRFVAIVPAGAP